MVLVLGNAAIVLHIGNDEEQINLQTNNLSDTRVRLLVRRTVGLCVYNNYLQQEGTCAVLEVTAAESIMGVG